MPDQREMPPKKRFLVDAEDGEHQREGPALEMDDQPEQAPALSKLQGAQAQKEHGRRGVIPPRQQQEGCCDICGTAMEATEHEEALKARRPEVLCHSCRSWRRYPRVGKEYNLDPASLPLPGNS